MREAVSTIQRPPHYIHASDEPNHERNHQGIRAERRTLPRRHIGQYAAKEYVNIPKDPGETGEDIRENHIREADFRAPRKEGYPQKGTGDERRGREMIVVVIVTSMMTMMI